MIDYPNGHSQPNYQNSPAAEHLPAPSLSDDLRRYLGLLWHWTWLIALLAIAGGAIGYVRSNRQPRTYLASATMLISESRTINEYANILASERLAQTYSQLMVQGPVLEGVIAELGLEEMLTSSQLKGKVTVAVVEETQLLTVSVEDEDPVRAAQIANTIGEVFARINQEFQTQRYADSKTTLSAQLAQMDSQIQETNDKLGELAENYQEVTMPDGSIQTVLTFEQQRERDRLESNLALYQQIYANLLQSFESVRLAEIQSTSTINLVEPASPPGGPIRPNVQQDTLLAAMTGLMIGLGLVFLIEALDDTVKGPGDVTRHLGLPVLGFVARMDDSAAGPITIAEPRSPISEAFRSLRTNIQYASVDRPLKNIAVTSPSPKDGKSTIATNLAIVMSQSGKKVAILDADMRRPSQHKRLQLTNRMGLSDLFVQDTVALNGALRETKVPGMALLTSGGLPPNPSELLGSEKMTEVLRQVHQQADVVIVDTPPVMAVTDAAVLAPKMDGVIIVIRPGTTKLGHTKQTVEQLRRSGASILGVVLNEVEHNRSRYYYYYKGYYTYDYYYYGEPGERKKKKRKKSSGPKADTPALANE
jgi:non-specific protein-tyrosine kinase